jgi:hypothetical protein
MVSEYIPEWTGEDRWTMDTIEDLGQIVTIAKEVATANLGHQSVKSVHSSQILDSMGRDALQIEITLTPGSSSAVSGTAASTTIFELNKRLQQAGEERFPIVRGSSGRPHMANPDFNHLFEQADRLITPLPSESEPRQTDLRRAVSAAYYGVFHFMVTAAVDMFVGEANRGTAQYNFAHRTVTHAWLRELCDHLRGLLKISASRS